MRRLLICCIMALIATYIQAQDVMRKGDTFVQITTTKTSNKEVKTQYTYIDSKGIEYPIWLSSTGKAFIWKISKKTGKQYKQYIPEVGKQINPEVYKNDKNNNTKKISTLGFS